MKEAFTKNILVTLILIAIHITSRPCSAVLLDPTVTQVEQFVTPLVIPPVMPPVNPSDSNTYKIAMRQFEQQILPPSFPVTTVWSYGPQDSPLDQTGLNTGFFAPSFTIEATKDVPVKVTWVNELIDTSGGYLPHLLPVDQTLHWANPPGPIDTRGLDPTPYTGPVPIVTHVHGAHVGSQSDGYPEAWFLPDANNIPEGYFTKGTHYNTEEPAPDGSAVFIYPNDQREATLWYHDHALGMTRLNVYAGPAGFYLIRGPQEATLNLPGPAPKLGDAPSVNYYEIPLAIQDRSFHTDGRLWYPDNRAFFEGLTPDKLQIPFIPEIACDGQQSDISPIWNPEFFGNTIIVNGRTWPYLKVEKRRYRFRILNGCQSRFLILRLSNGMPFYQIGTEGGFLPAVLTLNELLIAPAERADVIVDFTNREIGEKIIIENWGPDEPFGGGVPGDDFDPASPETTGRIMLFDVVAATGPDTSTPVEELDLPDDIPAVVETGNIREVTLNEEESTSVFVEETEDEGIVLDCDNEEEEKEPFAPKAALLGTLDDGPLTWMAPITENPVLDSTEEWYIHNFTEDAHPIHLHLVMFRVVKRIDEYGEYEPEPWETGWKDTVIVYPEQTTVVQATFDIAGLFVWHCHILEHEDNEMMRPYFVGQMP
jgi:FtsP/CotA-like multicopper oxidase with cupredoxin domain